MGTALRMPLPLTQPQWFGIFAIAMTARAIPSSSEAPETFPLQGAIWTGMASQTPLFIVLPTIPFIIITAAEEPRHFPGEILGIFQCIEMLRNSQLLL